MKLAGFNFSKINVERFSDNLKDIKINTKIDISKIDKFLPPSFEKELLRVEFSYLLDYSPNFAEIEFKGAVLFYAEQEEIKEILNGWKKKKLSDTFQTTLFNLILRKTNVKALELEEELNLPFHINLPSLKKKEEKE